MPNSFRGPVLVLILLVAGGGRVQAQMGGAASDSQNRFCSTSPSGSFDRRGLSLVYCEPPSVVAIPLEVAHASAYPAFYGAVPGAWIGAALTRDRAMARAAYRLTLTQGFSYGLIVGVKHAVGRPRPYVHLGLEARTERHDPPDPGDAHLSFPSGHAGLSAALATSWSLSYPRWYVIGAGAVWAAGVALSRVYLGVHFPSDVLVGAALGAGVAVLVHQLRASVTPPVLRGPSRPSRQGVPIVLRLQF